MKRAELHNRVGSLTGFFHLSYKSRDTRAPAKTLADIVEISAMGKESKSVDLKSKSEQKSPNVPKKGKRSEPQDSNKRRKKADCVQASYEQPQDGNENVSKKRKRSEPQDSKKRRKKADCVQASYEERKEMMRSLKEIASLLKDAQGYLITKAGLEKKILPYLKMPGLSPSGNWTQVLYSWRLKRPDIIPKPYTQDLDDCWAVGLSEAQNTAVSLSGFAREMLNPVLLRDGVCRRYQDVNRGIADIEHARSFLTGKYIDGMNIYRRPEKDYDDFEDLIEALLVESPVAVSFESLPSHRFYDGTGIYTPPDMECKLRDYEHLDEHVVLLTGCGIQFSDGVFTEFWEFLDSQGNDYGEMGFGRLVRGKGLIKFAVKMKV